MSCHPMMSSAAAATVAVALLVAAGAGAQQCGSPNNFGSDLSVGLKAIYGPDSRQDEADTTECWRSIGRSTVVLIQSANMGGSTWADCGLLGDRYRCPAGLRFSDQLTCGSCSGTLIAPDLIATAGHCINTESCSGVTAVFHATDQTMTAGNTVPTNTVYQCASVVTSVLSSGKDYAVFQLDRAVPASVATPVTVGTDPMPLGTGLMMIGHPSGIPRKYSGEASVTGVAGGGTDSLRYETDLDAFGGNSGSGVFTSGNSQNAAGDECYPPGLMVGILVAGQSDYDIAGCPVTYPQGEGGETVSGALTLLDHASSTASSTTFVLCSGTSPPTFEGQTFAPTAAPTTAAPTTQSAAYRGGIKCGDAKTGDTDIPGENIYGEASNHIYEFTVPAGFTGGFTFSTCNGTGGWDTYLRVIDPSSGQQIAHNDDSCDLLSTVTLPTGPNEPGEPGGSYLIVVDGYNASATGPYTLTMHTADPTGCPSYTYCPAGYTDPADGNRWNYGLGRVTRVDSHQECADRCTQYANLQPFGCKGFMTGMWYGMLFCKSYSGNLRTMGCAPWATPESNGVGSGTNNIGGNCCMRLDLQ